MTESRRSGHAYPTLNGRAYARKPSQQRLAQLLPARASALIRVLTSGTPRSEA